MLMLMLPGRLTPYGRGNEVVGERSGRRWPESAFGMAVVECREGRLKSYADDSSAALRGVLLTDEGSETGVVVCMRIGGCGAVSTAECVVYRYTIRSEAVTRTRQVGVSFGWRASSGSESGTAESSHSQVRGGPVVWSCVW